MEIKCILSGFYDKDQDTCVNKIMNSDNLSDKGDLKYSHDDGRM